MIGDSGNAYVVALVILAMVLVAVVGYHWLPKADVQLAVGNCRLDQQTACAADLPGGGRIEVAVAPRPVATSQAFEFRADLAGIRPNSVEVDGFNGPATSPFLARVLAHRFLDRQGGDPQHLKDAYEKWAKK